MRLLESISIDTSFKTPDHRFLIFTTNNHFFVYDIEYGTTTKKFEVRSEEKSHLDII